MPQYSVYEEKGIDMVSFSAKEATGRSPMDSQLWAS